MWDVFQTEIKLDVLLKPQVAFREESSRRPRRQWATYCVAHSVRARYSRRPRPSSNLLFSDDESTEARARIMAASHGDLLASIGRRRRRQTYIRTNRSAARNFVPNCLLKRSGIEHGLCVRFTSCSDLCHRIGQRLCVCVCTFPPH